MDPSRQFLSPSSSSPPWLKVDETNGEEGLQELRRKLDLERSSPPDAPEFLDLQQQYVAGEVQLLDETSDEFHKAGASLVWKHLYALLPQPKGRVKWDEWAVPLTAEILRDIERLVPLLERHRGKLVEQEKLMNKHARIVSGIISRNAQPGSSSASAHEGGSGLSEQDLTKLKELEKGLTEQGRKLGKCNVEPIKHISNLAGRVKTKMETTLDLQKSNYVLLSEVFSLYFP